MDIFSMYGSRSDDEPDGDAGLPEAADAPTATAVEQERAEADMDAAMAADEADAPVTEPVIRRTSASEDAVRRFVDAMAGVEFDGQIVRPYARTGGRTRSSIRLELETLLSLTNNGGSARLSADHRAICELCRQPMSVAEVAAYRGLPVGAARVVISDMIELGLLSAMTTAPDPSGPTVDIMRRVLNGLHRL